MARKVKTEKAEAKQYHGNCCHGNIITVMRLLPGRRSYSGQGPQVLRWWMTDMLTQHSLSDLITLKIRKII